MSYNVPHHIKQQYPSLPSHVQAMIYSQSPKAPPSVMQGPLQPYVPRPPRRKYIRRIARTIVFGFLMFAFTTAAISSYIHDHRTGYAHLGQASMAANHYTNPLPFLLAGVFFGLLAFLQARKTIKVHNLQRTHEESIQP
jgi:hypothetical protein